MRYCFITLLVLFAGTSSAFRARRQIESSGDETGSGIEEFSGTSGEMSGEFSGETSGLSGEEGSGELTVRTAGAESSGEGLTLDEAAMQRIQLAARTLKTQADAVVLQSKTINDQLKTLTSNAQDLGESSRELAAETATAALQAGVTPLPNVSSSNKNQTNSTCSPDNVCFSHSDCGSGTCLGLSVGTCNCNACPNFISCEDDTACGGLKGACNNATHTCDCFNGFAANGFPNFMDALTGLCGVKQCSETNSTSVCFGLPCNSGSCIC